MTTLKDSLSEKIFQLSSNLKIRKMFQVPYVRGVARFFYNGIFRPKQGKCFYIIDGIKAEFLPKSPEDFEYIMSGANLEQESIKELLEKFQPNDVVYDVGASMGFHAMFFAKKLSPGGKVISFEPEQSRYQNLCENIAVNNLQNITAFNLALGDVQKQGTIGKIEGADMRVEELSQKSGRQVIDIMPGDLFIAQKNLPQPTIVKIDVEGYEQAVISGLRNALKHPDCRMVFCEIHPEQLLPGTTKESILALLKELGFNDIHISGRGGTLGAMCYKTNH